MASLMNLKSAVVCGAVAMIAGTALIADDVKLPATEIPQVAPPQVAQPPALKDKIDNFELENTSINDALVLLQNVCNRKIVVDPRLKNALQTEVDLNAEDTRLDVILDKILTPNKMTWDIRDGQVVILPLGQPRAVANAPKAVALERNELMIPDVPEFAMPKMPKMVIPELPPFAGAQFRAMNRGEQLRFARKFLKTYSGGMKVPALDPAALPEMPVLPVFPEPAPIIIIP